MKAAPILFKILRSRTLPTWIEVMTTEFVRLYWKYLTIDERVKIIDRGLSQEEIAELDAQAEEAVFSAEINKKIEIMRLEYFDKLRTESAELFTLI